MSDETNHELLSAYLDGELAADERQRVEQLLAESAECRQVYEELCALRSSLSALPRHKLDEDLGPRVLRIAEQAMLGKASGPGAAARREEGTLVESAEGGVVRAGGMSAADRKSRAWRAIVYPVLAVAAAIAFMISSPKDKRERHIAQAPVKQAPQATLSAPADQSGTADEELSDSSSDDNIRLSASDTTTAAPPTGAAPPTAAARPAGGASAAKSRAAGDRPARLASGDKFAPPADAGYLAKSKITLVPPAASAAPASVAGPGQHKAEPGIPQATLVITCKLAPTAVSDKAFDTLLARNHLIPWSGPEALATKDSTRAGKPPAAKLATASNGPQGKETQLDLEAKRLEAESLPGRDKAWSKSVVVELDARQLVAVLADLQNHPEQFLSVELPGQPAGDRKQAETSEPDSDATTSGGDTASDEQAATVSDTVGSDDARTSNPAERAAESRGPGRLLVLFRLSTAGGN